MLVLNKFLSYTGLLVCTVATIFCPMLKVPIKGSWVFYQADTRLLFITLAILALGVLAIFLRKPSFFRITSILHSIWFLLSFVAVYVKVHHYFKFKLADKLIASTIHFQWGWVVWFLGILLMLSSVRKIVAI